MSGLRGRAAIALVARREITQRIREKSFLISMAVTVALVVLVAVVPPLFGFGGKQSFTVAVTDDASLAVAKTAQRSAKAFDTELKVRGSRRRRTRTPRVDGRQGRRGALRARARTRRSEPDATLVGLIETARREVRAVPGAQAGGAERGAGAASAQPAAAEGHDHASPSIRSATARARSRSSRCSRSTPSC